MEVVGTWLLVRMSFPKTECISNGADPTWTAPHAHGRTDAHGHPRTPTDPSSHLQKLLRRFREAFVRRACQHNGQRA